MPVPSRNGVDWLRAVSFETWAFLSRRSSAGLRLVSYRAPGCGSGFVNKASGVQLWLPGPVLGVFLKGVLYKMHPKPAPRGRGQSPRRLGAGFGCILYRIPFKSLPKTGPGSHIYAPEALMTNLE